MQNIEMNQKICEILKSIIPLDNFFPEMSLKDDLGIDSLALVNVLVQLEETFDITIDISDLSLEKLKTIGNLYTLVEKYISNKEE